MNADALICPTIVRNDASEGGEGVVRCDHTGKFSDDKTRWTCRAGHVIKRYPNAHCVVIQCPCRELAEVAS